MALHSKVMSHSAPKALLAAGASKTHFNKAVADHCVIEDTPGQKVGHWLARLQGEKKGHWDHDHGKSTGHKNFDKGVKAGHPEKDCEPTEPQPVTYGVVISDEPGATAPVIGNDPDPSVRAGDAFSYTIVAKASAAGQALLTTRLDPGVDFQFATVNGAPVETVFNPVTNNVRIVLDLGASTDATIVLVVAVREGVAPASTLTTTTTLSPLSGASQISDSETTVLLPAETDPTGNGPPVVVDDHFFGLQGQQVVGDVLANDYDPDGDTLLLVDASVSPGAGTVAIEQGLLVFTPDIAFFGDVVVTYSVSDGTGGTGTGLATISVLQNSAPQILEPVTFSVPNGERWVGTLNALDAEGDALTWSIAGGDDAALFQVDPVTGALSFLAAPDYANPADTGADNGYVVRIQVADAYGATQRNVLVDVEPALLANNNPYFTSPSIFILTSLTQRSVGVVTAVDPDGDMLEFALFGEDAGIFGIDAQTGELYVADENFSGQFLPRSFDGDRIYEVDVLVTDGRGGMATLDVTMPLFLGA